MGNKRALVLLMSATLVAMLAITGCSGSQAPASNASGADSAGSSAADGSADTVGGMAKIAAIYSAPQSQIVTDENGSKTTADTFVYIYDDGTYRQYVDHDGKLEPYSEGTCELNGELDTSKPVIVTFHVERLHQGDHGLKEVDLTYDVNLSNDNDFCLYPIEGNSDQEIVAAYMQVDKQKLVKEDGDETWLTTMWFYYADGTFEQFALSEDGHDIAFSEGVYSFSKGSFAEEGSVVTLHRTKKYQDGKGLATYDSTHDYEINSLGFLRVYPEG